MRAARVICVALAAVLLLAAPAPGADEMTQGGVDAQRTRTIPDGAVRPPLRQRWKVPIDAREVRVADGRVFVLRVIYGGLSLAALAADDGRTLWERHAGANDIGPWEMIYASGRLILFHASDDVKIQSFDPATGTPGWERSIPSDPPPVERPVAFDGVLYFLSESESESEGVRLFAVRASDGADVWAPVPFPEGNRGPVVDADRIYVANARGGTENLAAFARPTGAPIWSATLHHPEGTKSAMALRNGRLYTPMMSVVDAVTGARLGPGQAWLSTFPEGLVLSWSGSLWAWAADDPRRSVWGIQTQDFQPNANPLVVGPYVYSAAGKQRYIAAHSLFAARLSDGQIVWCQQLPIDEGEGRSAWPAAAGGGLLLFHVIDGLAAYESGGPPSSCPDQPAPYAGDSGPVGPLPAATPPGGSVAVMLRAARTDVAVGQGTTLSGSVTGAPGPVVIEADRWPLDGVWVPVRQVATDLSGRFSAPLAPRRNIRVRARVGGAVSLPVDVYADHPLRMRRLRAGSRRPLLTVNAPRGAPIRRARLHAYLRRGARGAWRLVASGRLGSRTRLTLPFPRGTLIRSDRVLVCRRERTPDAFGRPTWYGRACGSRRLR